MAPAPDPREFVDAMAAPLRAAASIARSLEGRVANRPKDGESTDIKAALTEADTSAQEALLAPLFERYPQVALEAEEDTPTARRFLNSGDDAEGLVVIDPIDGTLRFYLEQMGPYAIMIGLAVRNRYVAALVALPREDRIFAAAQGSGAGTVIGDSSSVRLGEVRATEEPGRRVFVSHNLPEQIVDRLRAQQYDVCPASGGAISIAPLLPGVCGGIRLVENTPHGVSVRGRIGALISREAGARVRGRHGPFSETPRTPEPVLIVSTTESDEANFLRALGPR